MKHALALSLLLLAPGLAPAALARRAEPAAIAATQEKKPADDEKKDADRPALEDYDLGKEGLAIEGYDPVAYFPEFGGKPTKGSDKITVRHRGVLYRFASEKNKKAFLEDPERFEPAYGGWCAWAMSDGKGTKTEVDPKSFTIEDGRLFLFYDGFWGDTRKSWRKNGGAPKLEPRADTNWKRISGEAPPAPKPEPKPEPEPAPPKKGDGKGGDGRA